MSGVAGFDAATATGVCAFVCSLGLVVAAGFAFLVLFEHGRTATRTRIVNLEPLLDARLVKDVALAAIPAPRNHFVSGLEFLEADRAAALAASVCSCNSVCFVFELSFHQRTLDAPIQSGVLSTQHAPVVGV